MVTAAWKEDLLLRKDAYVLASSSVRGCALAVLHLLILRATLFSVLCSQIWRHGRRRHVCTRTTTAHAAALSLPHVLTVTEVEEAADVSNGGTVTVSFSCSARSVATHA